MTHRRTAASMRTLLLVLTLGLLLTGCAGLIGPRERSIPLSRLQDSLDHRFPIHHRALALFELELSHPQLSLIPGDGRMALSLDASLAPALTGRSWSGSFTLSGRLALDLARNAVIISDARVERLSIDGVDEDKQRQFARVVNLVVDNAAKDIVVYNFHPEDLRLAGMQFAPTAIRTTAAELVVTFAPAK